MQYMDNVQHCPINHKCMNMLYGYVSIQTWFITAHLKFGSMISFCTSPIIIIIIWISFNSLVSGDTLCHTVYPKKYAHGFCFAMLCCCYTLTDFPISIRLASLALWQSNDCPSASKATLMNMDKYFMWIHYELLHNHNKAKHNKTVCIFLGIYCNSTWSKLVQVLACCLLAQTITWTNVDSSSVRSVSINLRIIFPEMLKVTVSRCWFVQIAHFKSQPHLSGNDNLIKKNSGVLHINIPKWDIAKSE